MSRTETEARRRGRRTLGIAAVVAIVLVALRTVALEPFRVPSSSMAPTLRPGDHVLVDKLTYRMRAPRRDDLVVFREPGSGSLLLKRVVALGGEQVAMRDGVLHVAGRARRERYVDLERVDSVFFGPVRVAAGAVFVLGDRREDSRDSRTFGAVPRSRIVGRVAVRLWPPR